MFRGRVTNGDETRATHEIRYFHVISLVLTMPVAGSEVKKEGPNKGREFWCCPGGPGTGCNLFQWQVLLCASLVGTTSVLTPDPFPHSQNNEPLGYQKEQTQATEPHSISNSTPF